MLYSILTFWLYLIIAGVVLGFIVGTLTWIGEGIGTLASNMWGFIALGFIMIGILIFILEVVS